MIEVGDPVREHEIERPGIPQETPQPVRREVELPDPQTVPEKEPQKVPA